MMQTGTDPRLKKLRKYESILVISGGGVIAFGLWSIIRAAIYFFLNPLDITQYLSDTELADIMSTAEADGTMALANHLGGFVTGIILFLMGIDLLLRIYVGMSARAYGRGKKRRSFYIIVASFMAFFLLSSIIVTIDDFLAPIIDAIQSNSPEALEETAKRGDQAASVSILVDITSLLVMIEMIVCGIRVRKLRKQLGITLEKKAGKELAKELAEEIGDELNDITGD